MQEIDKKAGLYNNLFMSIIFGVLFTIIGSFIIAGTFEWGNFFAQGFVSIITGNLIGVIIPVGKTSHNLANKITKPDSYLFKLVSATVLLFIILLFMCPILTVFTGVVLHGAPIKEILPNLYTLFLPFFIIGVIIVPLISVPVMNLSLRCAGISTNSEEASN